MPDVGHRRLPGGGHEVLGKRHDGASSSPAGSGGGAAMAKETAMVARRCELAVLVVLGVSLVCAAALPEPAKGGKGGGPIDLLILRGHSEWMFGQQPDLDKTYQKMLADRGYRVTVAGEQQVLTEAYLRQFNAVIYVGPSPLKNGLVIITCNISFFCVFPYRFD